MRAKRGEPRCAGTTGPRRASHVRSSCQTPPAACPWSHDRATRRHLNGGNAAAVQGDQPVPVLAAKHAGVRGQRRDGAVNDLLLASVGVAVDDISLIAADESDA